MATCRVKIRSEIEVDFETVLNAYDEDALKDEIMDKMITFDDDLVDKAEVVEIFDAVYDVEEEEAEDDEASEETLG